MKKEGWRRLVVMAVRDADEGKPDMLDRLALYLEQVQDARQALRDKGYGVTGTPILEQVAEVEAL